MSGSCLLPTFKAPCQRHRELILELKPSVMMIGGPPLYLGGGRVAEAQMKQALRNLERIVDAVPLVILEHHALRDEAWRPKMEGVFQKASREGTESSRLPSMRVKKTCSLSQGASRCIGTNRLPMSLDIG